MLPDSPSTQSQQIAWDFQVASLVSVIRYGSLGKSRYKQYLPGGINVPGRYPPRPIDERHYQLALRQHNQVAL